MKWSATQNNLGIAYGDLPRRDRGENLEQAIGAFEAALEVRTREEHPVDWAMTQNNLGIAYGDLARGDREENLERAIRAYEAALEVRTHDAHPVDWATTQNNLGNALANRAVIDRASACSLLKEAIASAKAALMVLTEDSFPHYHAIANARLEAHITAYETAKCGDDLSWNEIPPAV